MTNSFAKVTTQDQARPRTNIIGWFSVAIGAITSTLAVLLFLESRKSTPAADLPPGQLGALAVTASVLIPLAFAAIIAAVGLVGGLAGLVGLIFKPRWQGAVGVLLNLGTPIALLAIASLFPIR